MPLRFVLLKKMILLGDSSFCVAVFPLWQWHLWFGSIQARAAADTFGKCAGSMQAGGSSVAQVSLVQVVSKKCERRWKRCDFPIIVSQFQPWLRG